MRWPISIPVLLAAFVAVSCDQQPAEPDLAPEPELRTPHFSPAAHWTETWTDEFYEYIPCADEWAQFVLNGKATFTEFEDADGGFHFVGVGHWHGIGIGDNGSEWVASGVWPTIWYYAGDAGEAYHDHISDLWVGKGQAPSWNGFFNYQYTANANGELAVEIGSLRIVCE